MDFCELDGRRVEVVLEGTDSTRIVHGTATAGYDEMLRSVLRICLEEPHQPVLILAEDYWEGRIEPANSGSDYRLTIELE